MRRTVRGRSTLADVSGRFEIRVQGRLSERARAAFPGMVVVDVPAETVIRGWSDDADEVHGVLDRIQALGLRLVSLQQTPDTPDRRRGEG